MFYIWVLCAVGPTLEGDQPEFSIEIVLKSDEARSYNRIRCEAFSFPPASVTWILTSEDYPNGTNLLNLEQFNLTTSGENFTFSENAIVEMRNLRFEDDGNFTCIVENGEAVATRYFRLRVKCMFLFHHLTCHIIICPLPLPLPSANLRPLWPVLGIVCVFILVAISMLCHASVEKIIAVKKSHYKSPASSPS